MQLMRCEGSEACDAGDSDYERSRGCPPHGVGLRDRVDDRTEARGDEDRAAEVEAAPLRLVRVGRNHPEGGRGERDCDRKVDVEDHPPVGEFR
jgi:hypothetical protein